MSGREKLESFVGKWNTTGHIIAAGNSAVEIRGTDTYEWLPGSFFLLHKVDVMMGNEREQSLEIIGFNESSGTYPMHYYDSHGNSGTMTADVSNGIWTFLSNSMRSTGSFTEDGNILSGIWDQYLDNNWIPWMEVKLTRIRQKTP